jgi:pyruvate dehydrogenase E2 component (dihydrolipoamide acetyltransferase)
MAEAILMPRLSDTMTEGVIAAWHKKVGDPVKKGELLAEVETDKATMELESYKDGTLLHIGTEKGGKLQVNDLLAIIGAPGENITDLVRNSSSNSVAPASAETAAQPQQQEPAKQSEAPKQQSAAIDVSKMEEVILMPRLSDTMTEGVIASWHKKVGDSVKKGEVLADIETDKATMELESYKEGKLLHIGAGNGEKIAVNDLLAIIGNEKTDVNAILAGLKNGPSQQITGAQADKDVKSPAEPGAEQLAAEPRETQAVASSGSSNGIMNGDAGGRVKASPLAKKLAAEKGYDLSKISGSGDNGRIVKKDVDSFKPAAQAPEQKPAAAKQPVTQQYPAGQVSFEEVPVSQMRKTIAKRLAESKFSAPHFYLTIAIDMDRAVESRAKINEISPVKISFNDIVLKACAVALRQHPKVNSSWLGDKIRYNHHINIGVAVAVEEGLLVPVIRFADTKPLSVIASEVKEFAQKAKDKKLQPADWEGNTFTISNLGMFGIDEFTAIINPPDACILAIGAIQQVPVVKNGSVVPGNIMKVTLSCDHRVVDGATGAAFLQTLQKLLEEPLRMLA